MAVLGIDVSHEQGDVNWHRVSQSPHIRFAYIKATQGGTSEDPRFQANWAGARDAGLFHGAYHCAQPCGDPDAQAAYFAAVVGLPAWGELPPALNLETTDGLEPQAVVQWTLAFVRKAEELFARPLMICTGGLWRNKLGNPQLPQLRSRLLWSVRYHKNEPVVPNTWSHWDFWQFTDGQHGDVVDVEGVPGRCNCNRFRGDFAELSRLAAVEPGAGTGRYADDLCEPVRLLGDASASAWPHEHLVWPHQPVIRGEHVRRWQSRMCEYGFIINVDGVYGPESKLACLAFQRELGLMPDGIVGRATWDAAFVPK